MALQLQMKTIRKALLAALVAPVLTGVAGAFDTQTDGKVVIKAGRVITQAGEVLENGVIVIEGGRITAVGTDVEGPWDAEVIDKPDLTAFPGFVDAHTSRGMDRPNESVDVTPFLDIADSIDPVNFFFEDCLRQGITTINVQHGRDCVIGAQGMVVKPHGMTVEEMLVRPRSGVKVSAAAKSGKSQATQLQTLRQTFDDLRRELEAAVQDKKDDAGKDRREAMFQGRELEGEEAKGRAMRGTAWTVPDLELVPRGEIDEKLRPLLQMVEGRLNAFFYCRQPAEVHHALDIARENGFLARTVLVIEGACWKAADVIAEAGVPVVLEAPVVHTARDPLTGDEIETFVPGVLDEAGVRFALASENSSSESLWFQAAQCVAYGMDRQKALDAVTRVPAELLGLGKRVGSLEAGKDGNVLLLSGDPLSVQSWVEYVVLDGNLVYDRSKDVRVRQLLEGVQPEGTASEAEVEAASGDVEVDDGDDEESEQDEDEDPAEKEDER